MVRYLHLFSKWCSLIVKRVLLFQAIYYLFTGIWPIVHIKSFMDVSGYKTDIWLVKMVGLLTISIGSFILLNYSREAKSLWQLALFAALSYTFIDVYYSFSGVISKVYLADAAVEIIIIVLLFVADKKKFS